MQALVKLSGPNRKVWFLSDDGETIKYVKDGQQLYKLSGSGGGSKDDTTEVLIELENDQIYTLYNKNIESITLEPTVDFSYCTLKFITGNTAPTFSMPSAWKAIGADCVNDAFTPVANSEYNIAIDTVEQVVTVYVVASRCSDKVTSIKDRVLNGDILDWNDEED